MSTALKHPWLVLAGLTLGVTVTNSFTRFAYGMMLPAMQSEMGWNYAQAGWLNTANALGYLAGAILTMFLIRRVLSTTLFTFGLATATLALLCTGLNAELWWQTLWRILAGLFGAISFATAGTLAAGLFVGDHRSNTLAIAILFGSGGGLGILIPGFTLPLILDILGAGAWALGWMTIGALGLLFAPFGFWAARQLRSSTQSQNVVSSSLPVLRMLPEILGYAAFGLGYFVYLTFLSIWMHENGAGTGFVVSVWVILGLCIIVSPLVWRQVLARHATGLPLALVLLGMAIGTALPVVLPGNSGPPVSAVVFGLSVFMSPTAVTNFTRRNLPSECWGRSLSMFTVVFALAQTFGPYGAGLIGDLFDDIGVSLLIASGVLLFGAVVASFQRCLQNRPLSTVDPKRCPPS